MLGRSRKCQCATKSAARQGCQRRQVPAHVLHPVPCVAPQEAALERITPQVREVTLRQGLLRDAVRSAVQAVRTKRRTAEQADGELAQERAAVDEFAAEARTAEAEYESTTQVCGLI